MFKKLKQTVEMYDYFLSNIVRKKFNISNNIDRECYSLGKDFIQGSGSVSVFYQIHSFTREIGNAMIERIRDNFELTMGEEIRVNFINKIEKHVIDWGSPTMQLQLRAWREQEDETNQQSDVYNLSSTYTTMESSQWLRESLSTLYIEENKNKRDVLTVSFLINVVNSDLTNQGLVKFEVFLREFERYLKSYGLYIEKLNTDLSEVVKNCLPFNFEQCEKNKVVVSKNLITDMLYAKTMELRQGRIGENGVYILTDIYSGKGIFKKFKETDQSNETWIVTAEAGGGKSFAVKNIVLMLLSQGFNGTINDIEGDEYTALADWIASDNPDAVKVINMRKGGFVDPFPIPNLVGDADIDDSLFSQSVEYMTFSYKSIIGDKLFDEKYWADPILDAAIHELYLKHGVTKDKSTWSRSKSGTFKNILSVLDDAIKNKKPFDSLSEYIDVKEFIEICTIMYVKLETYLSDKGLRSDFFKHPLSVEELNDADLVIVSFNMKNTPESSVDPVQMKVMQLSAAILSFQRSVYSKYVLGKFNFKVWEEYQRWGDFKGSEAILGTNVTGGRKLGDVVLIITNSIASILYSDRDDHEKIFGNTTSFLVGAIGDSKVRADLLQRLSVPHLQGELDKIAIATTLNNKGDSISNSYNHAFLACLDRKEFSVGKVCLPYEITSSSLFKTGVNIQR